MFLFLPFVVADVLPSGGKSVEELAGGGGVIFFQVFFAGAGRFEGGALESVDVFAEFLGLEFMDDATFFPKLFTHWFEHLQLVQSTPRLTQAHFLSAQVDRSVQVQHWSSLGCLMFEFNLIASPPVGLKSIVACLVFFNRPLLRRRRRDTFKNGCSVDVEDEEGVGRSGVGFLFCFFVGRTGVDGAADTVVAMMEVTTTTEEAAIEAIGTIEALEIVLFPGRYWLQLQRHHSSYLK